MRKEKKILLRCIIVTLVLMITVLIAIIKSNTNENTDKLNINIKNETITNNIIEKQINDSEFVKKEIIIDNKLDYVKDRSTYYTIKNIYMKYLNLLGQNQKENIIKIISPEYQLKYDINKNENFKKYILTNDMQYFHIIALDILETRISESESIYILNGKCKIINKEIDLIDINAIVKVEDTNNIFYIYPNEYMKENGYNTLKKGDLFKNKLEKIIDNKINRYNYISKSDDEVAKEYIDNFKKNILYYTENLYNLMDEEYVKVRFGSKENFESYIQENKSSLLKMRLNNYEIKKNNNYFDYICTDQYKRTYIFRQYEDVMRYKVFLDSYTILSSKEKKEYSNLTTYKKAEKNVSKFINMLNTKDYSAIYNVLDKTYRKNTYKDLEEFKKYMQSNLFEINSYKVSDIDVIDEKNIDIYSIIFNAENNQEKKKVFIKMYLTNDDNFEILFEI